MFIMINYFRSCGNVRTVKDLRDPALVLLLHRAPRRLLPPLQVFFSLSFIILLLVLITKVGGKVKKIQMGNAELSRLWNLSQDNHEVLVQSAHTPSLDDFLKPILEDRPTLLKDDKVI